MVFSSSDFMQSFEEPFPRHHSVSDIPSSATRIPSFSIAWRCGELGNKIGLVLLMWMYAQTDLCKGATFIRLPASPEIGRWPISVAKECEILRCCISLADQKVPSKIAHRND
jgi:hypothetical protein